MSFLLLPQCSEQTGSSDSNTEPSSVDKEIVSKEQVINLPDEISFNEHIQPILSEYCYHCHGPDEKTRFPEENPLRLDLADAAFEPRENGKPVMIKGDADASYLVELLHSNDPETIMPPPESHKSLDAQQIALLEAWIDQGAEYQDHWSFIPVSNPNLPHVKWGNSPIDKFVGKRLEDAGLEPNPEQDAARLYRRIHFDITGLPPTPDNVSSFVDAYETDGEEALSKEIDRLLATIQSAEHFARHWLDNARYADTHGIHIDNYRAIWPYRDWVIQSFHKNQRWDEFTIEQIAGDMLDEPTLDQIVATGFHRCLPTTGEGGAIAEEYDAIYAQDRTDTTGAVWLGLTMGCASCHDHKFDPISMKDNYSFNAFFRNTTMQAMDRNNANHPPVIYVPLPEDRDQYAELNEKIAEFDKALAERSKEAEKNYQKWVESPEIQEPGRMDSTMALHLKFNEDKGPLTGFAGGKPVEWDVDVERIDGPLGKAPVISEKSIEIGDYGSFTRTDQVTIAGFVRFDGKPNGSIISRMSSKPNQKGWDIQLFDNQVTFNVIDKLPDAANKLTRLRTLKPGQWYHITITFDGLLEAEQTMALYIDGNRTEVGPDPSNIGTDIVSSAPLVLGARHGGDSKLTGGKVAVQDFRIYRRILLPEEVNRLMSLKQIAKIIDKPRDKWSADDNKKVYQYYLDYVDGPSMELAKQKAPLMRQIDEIKKRGSNSLIMEEKKNSEPFAHMLNRGVYSDKGEKVSANTPASLPPMTDDMPRNRLGLAKWLVSKDNPLTARVTMNRLWAQLFGTGIVETVGDFGIMGARPTHPKLLDWLAYEFMDSGWDYRHMVKTIIMSDTYRQAATTSPEKLEKDPHNTLLSRGPRYRLDAEQLRDLALSASELLSSKVGGAPVKPYQPEGIWAAVAMPQSNTKNYRQDSGESLYRRSIYTFWKRTAPPPSMEILNAPTREVTCVVREQTNTPLQAFVVMNDPQFVEASRQLASKAMSKDEFGERVDFISKRLIARTLDDSEKAMVKETLDDALTAYTDNPEEAEKLINVGETNPDSSLPAPELAAWTIIASQILNLDESLTK